MGAWVGRGGMWVEAGLCVGVGGAFGCVEVGGAFGCVEVGGAFGCRWVGNLGVGVDRALCESGRVFRVWVGAGFCVGAGEVYEQAEGGGGAGAVGAMGVTGAGLGAGQGGVGRGLGVGRAGAAVGAVGMAGVVGAAGGWWGQGQGYRTPGRQNMCPSPDFGQW